MRASRLLPALVAAVLTAVPAAGCAAPAPAVPGTAGGAAAPGPTTPGPASPGVPAAPAVEPPWPARSDAEAAGLQQAVDTGAQPWLLDPEETALSYAAVALGWTAAGAERTGADTVLVTGPGGARRELTLVQPARPGPGGIWSVTADRAAPFG